MNLKAKLIKFFTIRLIIGMLLGGTAGYLYYYYVGCVSGTCPMTSNPYITTIYGVVFGAVLFYSGKKSAQTKDSEVS
jgi:hypothetical protein